MNRSFGQGIDSAIAILEGGILADALEAFIDNSCHDDIDGMSLKDLCQALGSEDGADIAAWSGCFCFEAVICLVMTCQGFYYKDGSFYANPVPPRKGWVVSIESTDREYGRSCGWLAELGGPSMEIIRTWTSSRPAATCFKSQEEAMAAGERAAVDGWIDCFFIHREG